MKLLVLTNKDNFDGFRSEFEEVTIKSLADVMMGTGEIRVEVDGEPIDTYDAVYLDPGNRAFNYSRVLLETINEMEIPCNLNYSSYFMTAKKPYLYNVLAEKDVEIWKTACVSTNKGLTEIEKDIEPPILAEKYEGVENPESDIIEDLDDIHAFMEGVEHGHNYVTLQEYSEEEVYDVLYIDGQFISLKLDDNPWENSNPSRNYHSLSQEKKAVVDDAVSSLGISICRIILCGSKIVNLKNQHNLEMFQEISGKNVFGHVASHLKGDND